MLKRFKVVAGVKTENYKTHVIDDLEFSNLEEAMKCAEDYAYELYYQNPEIDIIEIKKIDGCNEAKAEVEFLHIMAKSIAYWVEEITPTGIIKHVPKHRDYRGLKDCEEI